MDSAIGLSLMVAIGPGAFGEMLAGFQAVDEHMAATPIAENVPALLGLIEVWYRTFCDLPVEPYSPTPGTPSLPRLSPAARHGVERKRVGDGEPVTHGPDRSSGVNPAPTNSTRSTNSCTRATP